MASGQKPGPVGLVTPTSLNPDPATAPKAGAATPGPLQSGEKTPGPRVELKVPPHFHQTALTCWASAIASWLLVKGIVKKGFSDESLIDYYEKKNMLKSIRALSSDEVVKEALAAI